MLVRHYGGMGYGEAKIRDELYRRRVPRELWKDALSKLPDAQEAIAHVIAQKTKGRALDEKGRKRLSDMLLDVYKRQVYAARIGDAWNITLDEQSLRERFSLITAEWTMGDN